MSRKEELDETASALLQEYRSLQTPSSEATATALDRVQARILSGNTAVDWDGPDSSMEGPGNGAGPAAAAAAQSGLLKWLGIGSVVLATGGGAWLVLQNPGTQIATPPAKPQPENAVAQLPESDFSQPAPGPTLNPKPPAPTAAGGVEAQEFAPPASPKVSNLAGSKDPDAPLLEGSASPTDLQPATEGSTLREEMRLLGRGQAALNSGNYAQALAAFEEHRSRFPNGSLSTERELKRISTLCKMGSKQQARAAAERFAAAHPSSASAEKARRICAESASGGKSPE